MDLDKTTADRDVESFVVSVKTHRFKFRNEFKANNIFFERGQEKSPIIEIDTKKS